MMQNRKNILNCLWFDCEQTGATKQIPLKKYEMIGIISTNKVIFLTTI